MSDNVIMSVKNLECAYSSDRIVLKVENLEIPRGKLVFIIGKSGVGKSTFIETLGIMNNTILDREDTSILLGEGENRNVELKACWKWPNQRLSDLRKRHFSFIFQNTNLMPGFSAGENMAISLLLQGLSLPEAKERVTSVMSRLSLNNDIFDKKVTEISGGQRQRLAFVRAVTSEYSILFGDEPTGNLDPSTAAELLNILKEMIKDRHKTAVLVSHDLNLALRFADLIVPITSIDDCSSDQSHGLISSDRIIMRTSNGWTDVKSNSIADPLDLLIKYLR